MHRPREHLVVAGQVHPRWRHQHRQACHQIQRFQHDVRRAVAVRGLERMRNGEPDATLDRIRERFGGVAVMRGSGLRRGSRD